MSPRHKGGISSDLSKALASKVTDSVKEEIAQVLNVNTDRMTAGQAIAYAQVAKAIKGDKNAFEALGSVVCDEDEKSAYVKESAVVALGNLGDNRALDVFSAIMSSNKMFLDKFSYLKERVVEAISKLDASKESKAIQILEKSLLEPSSRVRISSIEALMNLETSKSYELIYDRLMYDDDLEVRRNALVALYNLSDREILDKVIMGDFPFELKEFAKDLIHEYEDDNE